jgi:hypothetical protein
MRLSKVVCIAICFLLLATYVSAGEKVEKRYFKMKDGKIYSGEVLPSHYTTYKIRQENGEIIVLQISDMAESWKDTQSGDSVANVAQDSNGSAGKENGGGNLGMEFDLGIMYYHFDYKEDVPPPLKSEESGWLPGLYAGLKIVAPRKVYLNTYVEYSSDEVDYDGTNQVGTPVKGKSSATFLRFQFNIGYTVPVKSNILLSPYVGYGYRSWERGLKGASPLDETYIWHYFPVGLSSQFILNDKWSVNPGFEARFVYKGSMKAEFNNPNYNQLDFTLGNKTGFKFEVPIKYNITETWAITGNPWYSISEIGESEFETLTYSGVPISLAQEPSSETNQLGFNLIFSYKF